MTNIANNTIPVPKFGTGGTLVKAPDDVQVMLALHQKGWGSKKIAKSLSISRNTVKRYLSQKEWQPYVKLGRQKRLEGLQDWLEAKFIQHRGNAEVIRQELAKEHALEVSLRTVERAVKELRRRTFAEAKATVRFETEPGHQLQIDFGSMKIEIEGKEKRIYLFVATLGYSRRIYVEAFTHERQSAWMRGLEGAFRHFDGTPKEVLLDNPRALVVKHNPMTKEVLFNEKFLAFTRYWGVVPRACAPYRARTKGKDERAVGYVKRNAIAGRTFLSWEELRGHLHVWMETIADKRFHNTTREQPCQRFTREASALEPLRDKPPFLQIRELKRRVHVDAHIEIDTNRYSVPWSLIGTEVLVEIVEGLVQIFLIDGSQICSHQELKGNNRLHSTLQCHLEGIFGVRSLQAERSSVLSSELLRPLDEYSDAVGGGW